MSVTPGAPMYFENNRNGIAPNCAVCCLVCWEGQHHNSLYALMAGHSLAEQKLLYAKGAIGPTLRKVSGMVQYKLGQVDFGLARVLTDEGVPRTTQDDLKVRGWNGPLIGVIGNDRHFLSGSKVYVAGSFTGLQSAIIDNSVVPAGWSEDYIGLVSQTDLPLRLAGGDSGSPIFTPQGLLVGIYTGRVDDANGPRVGFLARTAVLETKVKLATWDNRHDWRDSAAD